MSRYWCASVGSRRQIGYGSDPVIVVVMIGSFGGMLIFAIPDGLNVQ